MSGLPGVGKSTLAEALARRIGSCVVSVDPIEDAILRAGIPQSFETGVAAYLVGATVAAAQLRLGLTVIADAANYLEVGRDIWRRAAAEAGVGTRAIEVLCSDEDVHRSRLVARERGLTAYPEPTWDDVVRRRGESEPWAEPHLVVDSVQQVEVNVALCVEYLLSA
jgi:predicted kinase